MTSRFFHKFGSPRSLYQKLTDFYRNQRIFDKVVSHNTAVVVPGIEIGETGNEGEQFIDNIVISTA
jgi:hypothetical protein